ncbi:iron chelate uptake ABC transporter family permease subunit [Sedimentitalea sp. XS_ASV28]|uniref:iron chelate uptake ABC transporter family permease subunit n=1 Tax=Sedimentitalea sp. XS_ASV28 TaxID=3241296 RepID=UPI003511E378
MDRRLTLLCGLLALSCVAFMLMGAVGSWEFLLQFRLRRLAALLLVGICLSTATVLFQTIAGNRILTPSLIGFDALYVLILTAMVQVLGLAGFAAIPAPVIFAINLAAMTALGMLLFGVLMFGARGDMIKLVLTGIVAGILIRSLTEFLQRMIDPSEFQMIQAASFARFTHVDTGLLVLTAAASLPALVLTWRTRFRLDVLALGSELATGLGENPQRGRRRVLALICVLVASATALAGPSGLFGLIVTALAYLVAPGTRHAVTLPTAALVGCIVLVAGQTVMERVLDLSTPLPVVVELLGGLVFLFLVLKRHIR